MQRAIELLKDKEREVKRLPKKSDFTNEEVCYIKAKLGAWNRALEAAELKEVSTHYLAKRQRVAEKRANKKGENNEKL